jgi:hypothetical protein
MAASWRSSSNGSSSSRGRECRFPRRWRGRGDHLRQNLNCHLLVHQESGNHRRVKQRQARPHRRRRPRLHVPPHASAPHAVGADSQKKVDFTPQRRERHIVPGASGLSQPVYQTGQAFGRVVDLAKSVRPPDGAARAGLPVRRRAGCRTAARNHRAAHVDGAVPPPIPRLIAAPPLSVPRGLNQHTIGAQEQKPFHRQHQNQQRFPHAHRTP